LTELTLSEQEPAASGVTEATVPASRENAANQKKNTPPAVRDLEDLRAQYDRRQTILEITGEVQDVAPLHEYVAAVGKSSLVASAQLKSIESILGEEGKRHTRFTLRVLLKPGYGSAAADEIQPLSPSTKQASAAGNAQLLIHHGGPSA
jgi:hypothetical protein